MNNTISEIFENFLNKPTPSKYGIGILVGIYFLLLLPILPLVSTFHSDEIFYTDASVQMIKSGDYISPYYPNGSLRTNKPILTYWIISAGYKLFGFNYFASRLGFLIAGCLVLFFTYKISITLFHDKTVSILSVLLLFSNFLLFEISLRSTTDILLCLFVCISLYGFINLMFTPKNALAHHIMAYVGAAMAIEAKGVLGCFPVLYAFFFYFIFKRSDIKIKKLINPWVIAGAISIALIWYVLIFLKHGNAGLQGLFGDQVGSRISESKLTLFFNLKDYLLALLKHFLPWSLFLLIGAVFEKKRIITFFKTNKLECLFICGWYLFLLAAFMNGNLQRNRYLLPAYPLLSVLFAAILMEIGRHKKVSLYINRFFIFILVLGSIIGAFFTLAGTMIDLRIFAAGVLPIVISTIFFIRVSIKQKLPVFIAFAIYFLVIFSSVTTFIKPVFDPMPVRELTKYIFENAGTESETIPLWSQNEYEHNFFGQIKVFSEGRIVFRLIPPDNIPQNPTYPLMLIPESYLKKMNLRDYHVKQFGSVLQSLSLNDILDLMKKIDREQVFSRIGEKFYLVSRQDKAGN